MTQDNSGNLPILDQEQTRNLVILKDETNLEKQSTQDNWTIENINTAVNTESDLGDSQTSNFVSSLNLDSQLQSDAEVTDDLWETNTPSVITSPAKKRKKITTEYLVPTQGNFTTQANNLVFSMIVTILFSSSIAVIAYSMQKTFNIPIHPMEIPYINTFEKCEAIGETWEEEECLDYEAGEHY